jgi:hypothetical protein
LGDKSKAELVRSQLLERKSLLDSNALHLWAGPSSLFQDVHTYLGETLYPFELRLLGRQEVLMDGVPVQMRRRFIEILTVLVLNPEGLNAEDLLVAVYGDKGTHETMRSDLSRLREVVPISAKPYRIQVPAKADFIELHRLISRGKIREALRVYQGSFFVESSAPAIDEEREYLDNALRQAVLASGDAEALMGLAQKLKDDLEVWEEAVKHVAKNDPRRVLAQARVQNVSSQWN